MLYISAPQLFEPTLKLGRYDFSKGSIAICIWILSATMAACVEWR
jgi:hypothetical protein